MSRLLSNQLKAMLVTEDIMGQDVSVTQSQCFTVQHFSYECSRRRNEAGVPYGLTAPSYLDFTVKVSSDNIGKVFFDRMCQNETFPYSFLFNASFNETRQLSVYEDAMVVTGYIVEAEENYEKDLLNLGTSTHMEIHARLLLSNISYLGNGKALDLTITKD